MEPLALWLEMMIKDGKLVWMRRGLEGREGLRSPGSTMGEPGSRDGAGPASPAVLPNGWIGKAVLVGEDTSQEAGASRAAVGVWTQLPCGGRGQSQTRSGDKGSAQPPLSWESLWDTH